MNGRTDDIGRFATRVVVAVAIVAGAILIWRVHDMLLLLFAAVLVAVILHAAADGLCRLVSLPRWLALLVAGLLIFGFVSGASYMFGHEITGQLSDLSDTLPSAWQGFVGWVGEERVQGALDAISPDGTTVASIAQYVVGTLSAAVSGALLALLGGIYLALSPEEYRKGALLLLPRAARDKVANAGDKTGHALRNWLIGQLVSMVATGAAVFLGMTLIGVPSALALGLVAGMFEFIPLVGPFLGAIPAVLIALTVDVETLLWTLGFFAVWQQIEGNGLAPIVMRYAVSIPPAVTLFALFLSGSLFGVIGILLGGPLTVAAYVLVRELWVGKEAKSDG